VQQLVEARRFQHAIMAVIIVNAATLGFETSPAMMDSFGGVLTGLDRLALGIFVLELLAKFYAYRLRFFRDPWNCFDFIVVGIALVPATGAFSVLRALRVLRVLRLVSVVPSMRRVVATLLAAIPGVTSIVGLLVLVIYVSAVMSTKLFAEASPDHFGNLGRSLWTLFQVMTGESWPDVANAVMAQEPMAWIFFLIFILISTFVVLNLFLAVMVNAMENVRAQEADDADPTGGAGAAAVAPPGPPLGPAPGAGASPPAEATILAELAALRQEVAAPRLRAPLSALARLLDPPLTAPPRPVLSYAEQARRTHV
jgi:voltage-gated sodium channel